jgi:hypothetical protein
MSGGHSLPPAQPVDRQTSSLGLVLETSLPTRSRSALQLRSWKSTEVAIRTCLLCQSR